MNNTFRKTFATAVILAALAVADIPGLFVVQEGRIADPDTSALITRTDFGFAQLAPIGDINKDNVQDLVAGSPLQDLGALQILLMTADGKLATVPTTISARHPLIKPYLSTSYPDKFGAGLGVVQPFSDSRSCAVVMTSSEGYRKLWALRICRDQVGATNGIDLTEAKVFDTSSVALSGLGLHGLGLGNSMSVLDTLSSGERVVAVGSAFDGFGKQTQEGRVILLAINPDSLTLRRLTAIPKIWSSSDPVAQILTSGEHFGLSIAPWHGANGKKGMVIVSPDFTDAGGNLAGRYHIVTLDGDTSFTSITSYSGANDPLKTGPVFSVASGDFDHDGNSDLALGYNAGSSAGYNQIGQVKILMLDGNGVPKDSTSIWKGTAGFIDPTNALTTNCEWGSRVALVDVDGDNQTDIIVGSPGNLAGSTPVVGSIWTLRLKQKPWQQKNPDSIMLSGTGWIQKTLSNYVTGNQLKWSVVLPSVLGPDPVATCRVSGTGLASVVECQAGTTNGVTKVRVVASDTGNIPATVHFTDTLEFPVRVSGVNNPPVQPKTLPTITLTEDHADTAVVVFSTYFADPEGGPLTVTVSGYDGTITNLLTFHQSANFDTLYIAPVQFKYGNGSLHVVVKDDFGSSIEAKLDVKVTHVNHVPVANTDNFDVFENLSSELDVLANDKDDDKDSLLPVLVDLPLHGKVAVKGSKVLFTPDSFYIGDDAFTYKANDGTALSAIASVKIKVNAYQGVPVVYRPLQNVTVLEDSPPIQVHADSLFFSGTTRFNYDIYTLKHNCLSLADLSFDSKTKILTISPYKYQSGQCNVTVRDYLPTDSVASTMTLIVTFVAHPYKFATRQILDSATPGKQHIVKLDSLDLDRKELEYIFGVGWPTWASVSGNTITIDPPLDAADFYGKLSVHEKAAPGAPPNPVTDSVTFLETILTNSGVHGRKFGGLKLDFVSQPGRLLVQNGSEPFHLELFSLRGQRFVGMSGEPFQVQTIDLPVSSSTVYMRLQEGRRMTISPLFLNH